MLQRTQSFLALASLLSNQYSINLYNLTPSELALGHFYLKVNYFSLYIVISVNNVVLYLTFIYVIEDVQQASSRLCWLLVESYGILTLKIIKSHFFIKYMI